MTIPERLLAMLLGVTALPLRVIYNSVQSVIQALSITFSALFWVPAFISTVLDRRGFSFHNNLLVTAFLVVPISVALIVIGLGLTGIYLVYSTLVDLISMTWSGLTTGFTDGMDGFWELWASQSSNLDWLVLMLQENTNQFAKEHQINNVEDFDLMQIDVTQLVDVESTLVEHEIPNMQIPVPSSFATLLKHEELQEAEVLNKKFLELDTPLSPELKKQLSQLKIKIERYKSLADRLSSVYQALADGHVTNIDNEVIEGVDVVTPILWFKQYNKDNNWYIVPGSSHVTDKDSLLHWLKLSPTDPNNRDIVKEPSRYKRMPTRYRWHSLTLEYCFAQELHEIAVEVQQLLETLPKELETLKDNRMSIGAVPQRFFGASLATGTEEPKASHSVVYHPG
ncbi:hypothetical protein [Legionella fallonii]|uniref:Coiled coil protein n=1 Tax=Legionella fallonii LLAP-10 TaxID=1212491 RepID=A0A098G7J6_9GAMM|nr:hypothetical protein [Legionella fallonii]CEG57939.1 conserved membrane protein of unknown function [Legionella fallonii LLAP-10]